MATSINSAKYPTLYNYAVVAYNSISINSSGDITQIKNGNYGTVNESIKGSGSITGTLDASNIGIANSQLGVSNNTLISDLLTINLPISYLDVSYNSGDILNIYPNKKYILNNSQNSISFNSCTINFVNQNNPSNQYFISIPNDITFSSINNMNLNGVNPGNIFWYAAFYITATNCSAIYGNLISTSGSVTITNTPNIFGNVYVWFSPSTSISITGNTTINGNNGPTVCYVKGTKILTDNGYKCIEDLQVNDKVVTNGKIIDNSYLDVNSEDNSEDNSEEKQDYILKPILWIGKFDKQILSSDSIPICIQKDALGENLPFEDFYISPGHRIILDDKMVLSKDLINGTTIYQDYNKESIIYYHLELESHFAITANGILSESYLDFNTRNIFEE
jgi:hypothetical protein